tara:strand:- start:255 stop:461 length:207 start_codon:yes stop_codon:yes gene_type:complete
MSDTGMVAFGCGLIMGVTLAVFVTINFYGPSVENRWRTEAVKHQAAEWITQEDGSVKWQWIREEWQDE